MWTGGAWRGDSGRSGRHCSGDGGSSLLRCRLLLTTGTSPWKRALAEQRQQRHQRAWLSHGCAGLSQKAMRVGLLTFATGPSEPGLLPGTCPSRLSWRSLFFSAASTPTTHLLLECYALRFGLWTCNLDMKRAFLHVPQDEEVYLWPPQEWTDHELAAGPPNLPWRRSVGWTRLCKDVARGHKLLGCFVACACG